MLDSTTKRRIDTARDILVGKIPDPKSQVEQITIALIYKFMDDMDAEAEELGGNRKFFADGFSNYGWARLMHSGLGGHEMLNLYAEAISRMPENPGIPPLFRSIFKNAYLPYRDPETLRSFLKIIDEFSYDHSERLGDAFEYLLSVLGSQGDAGQFRTPRHIIDFIVEILAPQKSETVLDPACGTAGFLISSYKHILKNNLDQNGYSTLTPDEKGRMVENFKGYDISPDMVRLSLVNLYLHGFSDPHILEYDTLTSQERWNEYADVILANPPFMSPKGGIRPHNRFSVQSKRSEVLFVDYIADHLTPSGRAGIIVPEGIIFQSQNAYKQLRKKLVEESLIAVISLPAGVFQPYSGVKTSILVLDKALAQKTDTIAFFKVENDGFGLGAQRRPIDKNDLPLVLEEIRGYLDYVKARDCPEEYTTALGLIIKREKVAENGEYNLSGERYRENLTRSISYQVVHLGDVADIIGGFAFRSSDMVDKPLNENYRPVLKIGNIMRDGSINIDEVKYHIFNAELSKYIVNKGDIVVALTGATVGKVAEVNINDLLLNQRVGVIRAKEAALQEYIMSMLHHSDFYQYCQVTAGGGAQGNIAPKDVMCYKIPLPPLEIQKEIVAEIESYQKVIDGARAVVENYRPRITIDPNWPLRDLNSISFKITDGTHKTPNYTDSGVPFLRVTDITNSNTSKKFISQEEHKELIKRCHPEKGDILYSKNGTIGIAKNVDWDWDFSIFVSLALIKPKTELVDSFYLECYLNSESAYKQANARSKSGTVTNLHLVDIKTIEVPLPPLETQKAIVVEIKSEQAMITANRGFIEHFEKKIENAINRIWGEET